MSTIWKLRAVVACVVLFGLACGSEPLVFAAGKPARPRKASRPPARSRPPGKGGPPKSGRPVSVKGKGDASKKITKPGRRFSSATAGRRNSSDSAGRRIAARRARSRTRNSSVSTRTTRSNAVTKKSRRGSLDAKLKALEVSNQMTVADTLTRNLNALDMNHGRSNAIIESAVQNIERASMQKFNMQVKKGADAKVANARGAARSSPAARRKSSSSRAGTPAKRRPQLRRSYSPETQKLREQVDRVSQQIRVSSPQFALGHHTQFELATSPIRNLYGVPIAPDPAKQAMRTQREWKTNEALARLSTSKGILESGSRIKNQLAGSN